MSTTPTLRDAAQASPCPFCGGDSTAPSHSQHRPGCYFLVLASVKAAPQGDVSWAPDLLAAWNRRAALTQGAGAVEPVATVEALQARLAKLEAELDDLEAERDEALRGPWPEWAKQMKKTIRKYSGYDGFDDASEGIDLAAELDELMEHAVEPSAQQLQQAVARATEEAAKRTLDHISKVIWVERDRYVTLLGKCIAQGDKKRADTYEQIARALDELHEGIQP